MKHAINRCPSCRAYVEFGADSVQFVGWMRNFAATPEAIEITYRYVKTCGDCAEEVASVRGTAMIELEPRLRGRELRIRFPHYRTAAADTPEGVRYDIAITAQIVATPTGPKDLAPADMVQLSARFAPDDLRSAARDG